jgi:hypothetical protein
LKFRTVRKLGVCVHCMSYKGPPVCLFICMFVCEAVS